MLNRVIYSRESIDWHAKGFQGRSLEELTAAHEIDNLMPRRASSDVATLLTLLSYRAPRRKPYLQELLRNTCFLTKHRPTKPRRKPRG
jgi:hypothetical protein